MRPRRTNGARPVDSLRARDSVAVAKKEDDTKRRRRGPLTKDETATVRKLIEDMGEGHAADALEISRQSLARIAAGMSVAVPMHTHIKVKLAEMEG